MTFRYECTREDYLNATMLQKANARQNNGIFHLMLLVGIGCLVYLNMSTLRAAFSKNDVVSYGAAIFVTALLLINYSPKLLSAVKFELGVRLGLVEDDSFQEQIFSYNEEFLSFQSGSVESRIGFEDLLRVNYDKKTVLFYFRNGVVQAVPMHALEDNQEERTKILEEISAFAVKASKRKRQDRIPAWEISGGKQFLCRITEQDVLACGGFQAKFFRHWRLKNPMQWLYLAVILFSAAGAMVGLADPSRIPGELALYLPVFYYAELIGAVIAIFYWYRPAFLTRLGIRQLLAAQGYPREYIGLRTVTWNDAQVAFQYGVNAVCLDMHPQTRCYTDEQNVYVCYRDMLVLFLPRKECPDKFLQQMTMQI